MKNKIIYIICFILAFSCKPKKPKWESGYLVPLLSTSLSIDKLVSDSAVRVEDDKSITLVYQQNLSTINLDDLVTIPNTGFERNYKLSNLNLNDQQFFQSITLAMLSQSWPGWGTLILASNGGTLALPDITNVSAGPFPVSIQNVFQEATLNGGFLDIEVTNGLPVDLQNVEFEIKNAGSGTVVVTHLFPTLNAGATETVTFNIAGKTIEGNLSLRLLNMDVMGGGQTYTINTSDALDVSLTLRNLQIQSATAVFPAQNIINESVVATLALGEPEIKQATISSGEVEIEVVSTVQDQIFFNYKFPKATKQGVAFEINEIIPAANSSNNSVNKFTYDFSGYDLDLTGNLGLGSNMLTGQLLGRIDSTGNLVTLDLDDSIYINILIKDLEPTYVKGYLGTYNESIGPEQQQFSLFNNFVDGELILEEVKTIFSIENSVGIKGSLTVNQLLGSNSKTGNSVNLQSSIIGTPIVIEKPTDNPLVPTYKTIELNSTNSNIVDLINITPDNLTYAFNLNLNQGVNSSTTDFQDFAYSTSYVKSNLGIEIPLSMIATNLKLRDTILFDDKETIEIEGAKSGILNLIVDNGFPISSSITLSILDASVDHQGINSLDVSKELVSTTKIEAASLVNRRVVNKTRSVVSFELSEDDILKLVNAKGIIINSTFNTADQNDFLKIYDDYELLIKLTGEFNYQN